jgi:hypothetical protein
MRPVSILCALLSALGFGAVLAEEYLPLGIDNFWEYDGVEGKHEVQTVTRTMLLWGTEVYVIEYSESTSNEGLENYWTTDPDGSVDIWGFYRTLDEWGDWGYLYNPPIRVLQPPLYLGKEWTTTVGQYSLPDSSFSGWLDFTFCVVEEGLVTVPAGTYYAYGIEQCLAAVRGRPLPDWVAIDGTSLDVPRARNPGNWWSGGIGCVQYSADDLYQLVQFNQPTPVTEVSWGRLKAEYRVR